MSIEGATSAPQIGRLFFRSHDDCFIHGTQWWLKYWNFSVTKDRLAIVRVTLPNGSVFLSTLSPNSVPWERVARGVNRRQYLEIDPKFALELGIGPDTQVFVESIREVEDCTSLVLAPVTPSDYDKLENFSEKIDFELTERIRVVSCRHSFPIWIDNVVVPVRVVSSDPSAHWVVLVPNRTLVHIQRDDTSSPNTGTGISTLSTPVQTSSGSEDTPSASNKSNSTISTLSLPPSQQSAKRHWDFPNGGHKKSRKKSSSSVRSNSTTGSSVDTSPAEDSDPLENSIISGISGMWSTFSKYLSRDNSQVDEQPPQRLNLRDTAFNASQDSVGFNPQQLPFPGVNLGEVSDFGNSFDSEQAARPDALPPRAQLDPNASSHRQLMQELRHTVPPYTGPLYSGGGRPGTHTPDPSLPGRAESGGRTKQTEPSKGKHQRVHTWHSGSDFSKYSRPNSSRTPPRSTRLAPTPRILASLRAQPHGINGIRSFRPDSTTDHLWPQDRLFDIFIHPSTIPEIYQYQQSNAEALLVEISATNPVPCDLKEPKPSTIQEDINDLKHDARSVSSVQSSRTDGPVNSALPYCLVVRLCFATRVRLVDGAITSTIEDLCHQRELVEDESVSEGPGDVLVAMDHVVMSDVVRQQLGIKQCSVVRVLHVKDEWRIPYTDKPSLTLQPLKPEDKHRPVHIKTSLEDWIRAVSHLSPVGAVLVNKQIVPVMRNNDGEWVYCRIWINRHTRKLAPHIYYLLVTPALIDKNKLPLHVDFPSSSNGSSIARPVMVHLQRDPSPSRDETVIMPAMKNLNQLVVSIGIEQFGALESLHREGVEYLQTVFSKPGRGGTLLVCGMSGSGGSGCGKTTLAKLLSKAVCGHPHYSNLAFIDCTALRGLTTQNFKKRLKAQFCEAIRNEPSVILLDDLDHTMPHVSDAQEQVGEEGNASIRKTQVLLDLLELVQRREARVVVIATAQNKQQLNKDLMQSRGVHVFEKTLEITPPTLADRKVILTSILSSKAANTLNDQELRAVAVKTEGFQPGDLVTLVDRAISLCELRTLCPAGAAINTPASPDKTPKWTKKQRSRVSTDGASSDYEYSSSPGLSKSPLVYSSSPTFSTPPSSPRKKHRGSDGNPKLTQLKKTSLVSTESTHTLIPEDSIMEGDRQLRHSTSLSQMRLCVEDFSNALKGFVPVSLRGLPLHRGGAIDFSGVGGLKTVKKCLKETLQWPSKYPRLFGQCPIKQRCGVLLYGAPGTGKTMLAGAVAKEFGLNFVSIKGPELLSKYIGASEQAVRDVFTRALCAKPCILFFDEFDSLAPRRGHDNTGVTDRVVNQLLTQLDGVESLQGVYVLAASSRPDLIDPALLRPGRIDRSLLCDMPTEEERTEILKALSHKMPLARDVDLKVIASKAIGMTGADLKGVLYSAQLQAAHETLARKYESREPSLSGSSETQATSKPDTSGRGSSIASGSTRRPLVFNFTDGGARRKSQVPSAVESTALALQRRGSGHILQQRRATLTRDTASEGSIFGKKKGRPILITQEHLLYGLTQVQPSVSQQKLKKFNQIYHKFSGKTKTTLENIKPTATMA